MNFRLSLTLVLLWLMGSATGSAAAAPPPPSTPGGLTGAGWQAIRSQVAKLTAADGADEDEFGWSVSIDGDTAVIGAYGAGVNGDEGRGAAYVFYRNEGGPEAWGQVATLTAADGDPQDHFGSSVSIDGDTVVVGAPWNDWIFLDRGAAYVFDRNEGGPDAWGQVATLIATAGSELDRFGCSVSVDGDTVVVGAFGADVGGNEGQGAAYVFFRNEGGREAWGQVAKLTAADGAAHDWFGYSVSADDGTAIVGARYANVEGVNGQGAAYVFYRDQGGAAAWSEVAKLTAGDGWYSDSFGASVSLSADTAAIGAVWADVGGNEDQGAAYVFYRDAGGPSAWGEVAKLTAADGQPDDFFGCSVSASGDAVAAGARGAAEGSNPSQGAAYIFYRNEGGPDSWDQAARLTADDGGAFDGFGWSVSVSGDTAVAGAPEAGVDGNDEQGAAYVYKLPAIHLNALQLLKVQAPAPGIYYLLAIARIHDEDHAAAGGVTVYGEFRYPGGYLLSRQAVTKPNGLGVLLTITPQTGLHRFCVTGMEKEGFLYYPAANDTSPCRIISVAP